MIFPHPRDVTQGFIASLYILRVQWKFTRSVKSHLIAYGAILSVLTMIVIMSYAGTFVLFAAVEQDGIVQIYARSYLSSFSRGELGGIGAAALGLSILSAVVSPFTGATATSFIPPKELASLSVTKWQRFSDSVVAQFMSSISVLQLITLVTLTSILTIDSRGNLSGMLFTFTVWLVLVSLTILSLWCAEYVHRRFGRRARTLIMSGIFLIVSTVILFDPNHGTTVFGIGTMYANNVVSINSQSAGVRIATYSAIIVAALFIFYLSAAISSGALMFPEPSSVKKMNSTKRTFFKKNSVTSMLIYSILRSSEIKKPIIASVIIGIGVVTLMPSNSAVNSTFTVIIPLVIALAWGSNALSHIGGGMRWLLTLPNSMNNTPWVIFIMQVVSSVGLFTLIWLPSLIIGNGSLSTFLGSLMAFVSASFIVSRSAVSKAIHHPSPAHFGSRGESSLSPITALQYTLKFALWGGQYGVIVLASDNMKIRLSLMTVAIIYQLVRMVRINEYWNEPGNKGFIAAQVIND